MPRHESYLPHGVIPAALLPFNEDLSIDEASFRSHLRDLAAVQGISAITINAHASEVASCSFDEQQRVLAVAQDEIGAHLPIINGIYSEGPFEAARLAGMAHAGGASALRSGSPAASAITRPSGRVESRLGRISNFAASKRTVDPSDRTNRIKSAPWGPRP